MSARHRELKTSLDGNRNNCIAIGIPCCNRRWRLQRTIDCLRAQTHANWTALNK